MTTQTNTSEARKIRTVPIERRAGVSTTEFFSDYLYPKRPVILTDAMEGWSALSKWTPDFFKQNFSERTVVVARSKKFYKMNMGEFIDYAMKFVEVKISDPEAEPYYLRNVIVSKTFPELLDSFWVARHFLPNWLERWPMKHLFTLGESSSSELFIGPPGARVPLIHRDRFMTHSWLSQVTGEKDFWMIAPAEDHLVYQDPEKPDHSRVNSMKNPDLESFPLFSKVTMYYALLKPGDTIFIPAGWWHAAECTSFSISLSGNFVNDSNYGEFKRMTVLPAFSKGGRAKTLINQSVLNVAGLLCGIRDLGIRRRAA